MYTRSSTIIATSALLLAALACRDDSAAPTEPAPTSPQGSVTAASALAFWQVSAGDDHTCGVTTDNQAYCWGDGISGELGIGYTPDPAPECWDWEACVNQPAAVIGGLRFRVVSAGWWHTCGITTEDRAYCWGDNSYGQLGVGTATGPETCYLHSDYEWPCSDHPIAVGGGLRFRNVNAGGRHTCGVTTGGLAYCWGLNSSGQLGDGTTTTRLTPRLVAGGRQFRTLNAGRDHTCGLTPDDRAYCWGSNSDGQLGDSTQVARRLRAVRVSGGRRFKQLDAGGAHTCAVNPYDRGFCWGSNSYGQLGTGGTYLKSFWPRRVAGELSIYRVTAGGRHTCGEATNHRAYCWGYNSDGHLGDGTTTQRVSPVAVTGGLLFAQVSAGGDHTCAKTSAGKGYCWGSNRYGQLGILLPEGSWGGRRLTPEEVAGPE